MEQATVKRNGRRVRKFRGAGAMEKAVGYIADATGKHPEFVFDELRHNRPVVNDQGDQSCWITEYEFR